MCFVSVGLSSSTWRYQTMMTHVLWKCWKSKIHCIAWSRWQWLHSLIFHSDDVEFSFNENRDQWLRSRSRIYEIYFHSFFHRKSILWIQSQWRFRHINIGVVGSRALVQLFNDLIKIQTNMSRSATIPTHQQNNKHTVFNVHSGWEMSFDWNALLMMMRTERIKINNHRLSSFLVVV